MLDPGFVLFFVLFLKGLVESRMPPRKSQRREGHDASQRITFVPPMKTQRAQVVEVLGRCNYDSLGVPTAIDGVGQGPKVVQLVKMMRVQGTFFYGCMTISTFWPFQDT